MDVDTDIVDYIWNTYGIQQSHVSNSVICKRADEYSAIYYLLIRKRDREDVKLLERGLEEESKKPVDGNLNKDVSSKNVKNDKENDKNNAVLAEMVSFFFIPFLTIYHYDLYSVCVN